MMKIRSLILTAALVGAGSSALADLQLNAGPMYIRGEDEEAGGFELGVGWYAKHSTSSLASSINLGYLAIASLKEDNPSFEVESDYSVLGLDYKLYFPLMQDGGLSAYIEGFAGGANTTAEVDIDDIEVEEWGFAWGVGGGLEYDFTDTVGLSLGYTFLGLNEPNEGGYALGAESLHLVRLNLVVRF